MGSLQHFDETWKTPSWTFLSAELIELKLVVLATTREAATTTHYKCCRNRTCHRLGTGISILHTLFYFILTRVPWHGFSHPCTFNNMETKRYSLIYPGSHHLQMAEVEFGPISKVHLVLSKHWGLSEPRKVNEMRTFRKLIYSYFWVFIVGFCFFFFLCSCFQSSFWKAITLLQLNEGLNRFLSQ